jgi:endonuclease YncB( thermonuclease family)
MANDILLFKERRVLGLTERRWRWLGRRASLALIVIVWGFAAYQFGAERSARLASHIWDFVRSHDVGSRLSGEAALVRRMPVCLGPVRFNCVVDGDTAWVDGEKIRLSGIDAPEIAGRCSAERELAQRAKIRLSELLSSQPFTVARSGTDRYGRTLATLYLREGGDTGEVMTREGLVRPWTGRRMPWC